MGCSWWWGQGSTALLAHFGFMSYVPTANAAAFQLVTSRGQEGVVHLPHHHVFKEGIFISIHQGWSLQEMRQWTRGAGALRWYQAFALSGAWLAGPCLCWRSNWSQEVKSGRNFQPGQNGSDSGWFSPSSATYGSRSLPRIIWLYLTSSLPCHCGL